MAAPGPPEVVDFPPAGSRAGVRGRGRLRPDRRRLRACTHDRSTGIVHPIELFVAVLGASNYTYAEATETQRSADFIHNHAGRSSISVGYPPRSCRISSRPAFAAHHRDLHLTSRCKRRAGCVRHALMKASSAALT